MKKVLAILFFILAWSNVQLAFAQSASANIQARLLSLLHNQDYEQVILLATEAENNIDSKDISIRLDNYAYWQTSLLALQRYEDAILVGLKAEKLSVSDYRIIENMGKAYYFYGDGDAALPYLQRYVALHNNSDIIATSYAYMGEIYMNKGKYQHADMAFSTALHYNNHVDNWWYRLGFAQEMSKNRDKAKASYQRALKLNPNMIEARNRLAAL